MRFVFDYLSSIFSPIVLWHEIQLVVRSTLFLVLDCYTVTQLATQLQQQRQEKTGQNTCSLRHGKNEISGLKLQKYAV